MQPRQEEGQANLTVALPLPPHPIKVLLRVKVPMENVQATTTVRAI
jgi:hypothetical protein